MVIFPYFSSEYIFCYVSVSYIFGLLLSINMKKNVVIVLTSIGLIFLGINFWFNPNQLANINSSSITGLATMRAMAQEAIAYEVAINNEKPTLIEFYADWCTTCQSMSPVLKKLKEKYGEQINFVMINIDYPQNSQLIKNYNVNGVPQLTFLDYQERTMDNLIGKVPEKFLESTLVKLEPSAVPIQNYQGKIQNQKFIHFAFCLLNSKTGFPR